MKITVDEREHALYERLDDKLSCMKTPSFVILEKEVLVLQKEIEFHKKEIQAIKNIQKDD